MDQSLFNPAKQYQDEARFILETGVQMGLILVEDEAKSLAIIRERLLQ